MRNKLHETIFSIQERYQSRVPARYCQDFGPRFTSTLLLILLIAIRLPRVSWKRWASSVILSEIGKAGIESNSRDRKQENNHGYSWENGGFSVKLAKNDPDFKPLLWFLAVASVPSISKTPTNKTWIIHWKKRLQKLSKIYRFPWGFNLWKWSPSMQRPSKSFHISLLELHLPDPHTSHELPAANRIWPKRLSFLNEVEWTKLRI